MTPRIISQSLELAGLRVLIVQTKPRSFVVRVEGSELLLHHAKFHSRAAAEEHYQEAVMKIIKANALV